MRLFSTIISLLLTWSSCLAINTVETVTNVRADRTLTTPVDLTITATNRCISGCTVDIACEDAAIVFKNVKPSVVLSDYLDKITVNGQPARRYINCRVSIYRHGTILQPFGSAYKALTVYSEPDFQGESNGYKIGNVEKNLGEWDNRIRSFKLKRGYMVTFANHTDGTGYSHCYIADYKDLEINLPAEMAGRVSMLRVFFWQWPAKKGVCDLNGENERSALNASWFYTWGAGENSRTDAESVPMRHHETGSYYPGGTTIDQWAWPGFDEINSRNETVTHVLGTNEPDNPGAGEVYMEPEELIKVHKEYLASGMRIGTFACCNPNTDWLNRYLTLVREQNMRCDFVATHFYIGGQSPENVINSLRNLHNVSGLPVWVTEWNNGANWTGESGFYTDSEGWYNWGSGDDNRKNGVFITDVLRRADNENWLERLSVFSNVESKRMLWENGHITPGGQLYADYQSGYAYHFENEYFMKWNYSNPTNLEASYKKSSKTIRLTWTNPNTDMTDSSEVQQQIDGDWVTVATLPMSESDKMSYTLDAAGWEPGIYVFRIKNNDADKNPRRRSEEVGVTITNADSVGALQYGRLVLQTTETTEVELTAYTEAPVVVTGLISYKNTTNGINNNVTSIDANNFSVRMVPWNLKTPVSISKAESMDFLSLPQGTFHLGDMTIVSAKAGSVKSTGTRVTFPEPFPEGVKPVVVCQNVYSRQSISPSSVRVTAVDNLGFNVCIQRQEGETSTFSSQTVYYIAATPGQTSLGKGKMLTVYNDQSVPVGGTSACLVPLSPNDEHFLNAFIVAAPQSDNYEKYNIIRQSAIGTEDVETTDGTVAGAYRLTLRRQIDGTSTSTATNSTDNGDYMGMFIISDDPEGNSDAEPVIPSTGINSITSSLTSTMSPYDLQGRKLNHDAHGIMIVNGKKVIRR